MFRREPTVLVPSLDDLRVKNGSIVGIHVARPPRAFSALGTLTALPCLRVLVQGFAEDVAEGEGGAA